jgi:hypothetical protein
MLLADLWRSNLKHRLAFVGYLPTSPHCRSHDRTDMHPRRLLTLGPEDEPLWVRVYVHQIGESWAAMIVGDAVLPPEPGTLTGLVGHGEGSRCDGKPSPG